MNAIIATHPIQNFKSCLYGLSYDKLLKLAEFRSGVRKTIKKSFKTITYTSDFELAKKAEGITKYRITDEMYEHEIKTYFEI